jgi:penicillin-binding protein 1C
MGYWAPKIAVAAEDKRFYAHLGVDPLALIRATWQNLTALKIVSGASTITAQTVRLLNPGPRTLTRKIDEFVKALKLESELSKDQILELYLNLAPFGGNIKGVGAASYAYFQKKPADLSLAESATLIAILKNPSLYRPDRQPELAKGRRDLILTRLAKKGVIALAEKDLAVKEPLTATRKAIPKAAPHFAELVLKANPRDWLLGGPDYQGLATSLNLAFQKKLEFRLNQALAPYPERIAGAGALIEVATGRIVAYVGNARPLGPEGSVDCVKGRRSPGSTLKPFVYLEALAKGLLAPASLLADTPLGLDGQAPRNFDRRYRGPVSVQKALADSLNAPAVRVTRLLGPETTKDVLSRAGFLVASDRDYGDSLVLGGSEVSLFELLRAYAALARGGPDRQITAGAAVFIDPNEQQKSTDALTDLFEPGASWLINQILSQPNRWPYGLAGDGLAFKTGTSPGNRDAWLAIYNPTYAAVLWLGDPSGARYPDLSGFNALAAAGVLYFRDLGAKASFPPAPPAVETYLACPLSGEPKGPFCPEGIWAYRLKDKAKTRPCPLHVRQNGAMKINWPQDLALFMSPSAVSGAKSPTIVSPAPGSVIWGTASGLSLPLKSEGAVGVVYWFLDGEFVAVAGPGRVPTLPLTPGRRRLSLVDSRDRVAYSEFTVLRPKVKTLVPILKSSS